MTVLSKAELFVWWQARFSLSLLYRPSFRSCSLACVHKVHDSQLSMAVDYL